MTRHIRKRIRDLQHLEKVLVAFGGISFTGFLITASSLDSTSWVPLLSCGISIGAAALIGWACEHVSQMIAAEQERLSARIDRMREVQYKEDREYNSLR